jgi:hypothetical protein
MDIWLQADEKLSGAIVWNAITSIAKLKMRRLVWLARNLCWITSDGLLQGRNTCPEDGARTELVEQYLDHCLEKCLQCGELYRFWEDEDLSNRS